MKRITTIAAAMFLFALIGNLAALAFEDDPNADNWRTPKTDEELRYWLENMVWYHDFTSEEIELATGLKPKEIEQALQKFNIAKSTKPRRNPEKILFVPYPGGRHPRIGFLDGAIRPQRETKISVFAPWDESSYVVLDVPEAIWSNLGLTYLAHTHVPTIFDKQEIKLEEQEWERRDDGGLFLKRKLPNGITFTSEVIGKPDHLRMEMTLTNGTAEKLTGLRVQNCVMLKGAKGFSEQTNDNKVIEGPYVACRDETGRRWIIVAWQPLNRAWANPPCPCLHSDPQFPDCDPGQTSQVHGWFSFYEGEDLKTEIKRIDVLKWWEGK